MKNWKRFFLTVFGCFAVVSMVVFNSCEKDSCMDLNCKNNAACSDGVCQCPAGWEGVECEKPVSASFVGTWEGALRCDSPSMQQVQQVAMNISLVVEPDQIHLDFPLLNDSLSLDGTAQATEALFTKEEAGTKTHVYATVDGDLIQVFFKVANPSKSSGQVCYFTGYRNKEE